MGVIADKDINIKLGRRELNFPKDVELCSDKMDIFFDKLNFETNKISEEIDNMMENIRVKLEMERKEEVPETEEIKQEMHKKYEADAVQYLNQFDPENYEEKEEALIDNKEDDLDILVDLFNKRMKKINTTRNILLEDLKELNEEKRD
ncbi:MAG: hypothetical protein MJ252_07665 [archaeon]|nr:hypothetical protein [archaeon]